MWSHYCHFIEEELGLRELERLSNLLKFMESKWQSLHLRESESNPVLRLEWAPAWSRGLVTQTAGSAPSPQIWGFSRFWVVPKDLHF